MFLRGINIGWFEQEYGHDLGPRPGAPEWPVWMDTNRAQAERQLRHIAAAGFSPIRLWLFEAGEGLVLDGEGLVAVIDSRFLANLDFLLGVAADVGVQFYFCLLQLYGAPEHMRNVITNEAALDAYLKNALIPLAERLRGNPAVWAFDIYNEIERDVRGWMGNRRFRGTTWTCAREFIRRNVDAIKRADAARLVSCGSGWREWRNVRRGAYSELGLDFYDVHVYEKPKRLPPVHRLGADRPVLIGEFGPAAKPLSLQRLEAVSVEIDAIARERGYMGYLLWRYGRAGDEDNHTLVDSAGEWRLKLTQ